MPPGEFKRPEYLGDGLYASYDGYQFTLRANDPVRPSDTIFLNEQVTSAFISYVERVLGRQFVIGDNT